jgi:hypothetical protein
MARLVSLGRSGILRDTPLAPSRTASDDKYAPTPLTPKEQRTVREAQDDFAVFLRDVFPLSFEGQRFLWADGTYRDFTLGDFHIQLARLIQGELEGGGKSRFAFMAPRLHLKSTVLNYASPSGSCFGGTGLAAETGWMPRTSTASSSATRMT